MLFFFFSSRRRHTRSTRDWSSDVCTSDLGDPAATVATVTTQFVPPLTPAQMTQLAGFYNGAVGLDYDVANSVNDLNISEGTTTDTAHTVTVVGYTPLDLNLTVGDQFVIAWGTALDLPAGYQGTFSVTAINVANPFFPPNYAFQYTAATTGLATVNE